eukprot:CAMPEP_0117440836 /NCGR_PEP_ID=MMETSP0759-20121206/3302_1 /TAXON_ID=63605 /ORGANISM="Percolomonas cosmopolitus, Strain WS" /LENGTH=618 /DNA_ID=CAMNT_0005232627 /DNA_START=1077 /DNA_END=2933 /DNA_ORIENTATION=-
MTSQLDFTQLIRKLTKKSAFVQEKVRVKSVNDINLFLQDYANILEMIHCRMLWRGLLHGFHLCDGFDKQQELAGDLSRLFWHIVTPAEFNDETADVEELALEPLEKQQLRGEKFVLWMNAFYAELTRMWKYLDKWMLSKFMSLVRYSFHETMKYLYLSYDLTFDFKEVKDSDAIQTTIHSSNMVDPLPDESDTAAVKKFVEPRKKKISKAADGTLVDCSIIDFYNVMMNQNVLVSDGLYTSDIALFHVDILVMEYVKMISELVRDTDPDAVVEALDEEQTTVFVSIMKPYMNTYLASVSHPFINKFQKSILEPLLADTDALLIEKVFKLLNSQKVKTSRQQDVQKWRTKYKLRLTDLRASQGSDPLASLQEELEQFSKQMETKQEKSDKKKRRKANKKKREATNVETPAAGEDPMEDVEPEAPQVAEAPAVEEQPTNNGEKKKRKKRRKSKKKNAETTNGQVHPAHATISSTTTTATSITSTVSNTPAASAIEDKKAKPKKESKKSAAPLVVTLDKEKRVQIASSTSNKKKEDATVVPSKKRVSFDFDKNQLKVYKLNSKVKNFPKDTSATPEKGILKSPGKSGKDKKSNKKRKRAATHGGVENISAARVSKRMRQIR